MKTLVISLIPTFLLIPFFATAQVTDTQAIYRSEADSLITIRKVTVLPFLDNAQGIYARPLENYLIENLKKSHRFDYIDANMVGPLVSPEDLEQDQEAMTRLANSLNVDAFFVGRVSKGPNGISLALNFFLTKDKKLFAKGEVRDYKRIDISSLKDQMDSLQNQILQKIPYGGLVISRQGNRVTVNLGKQDGLQPDQVLSVIQVIKLNRHPKFNFIINTEKEILGKVKLVKIDDALSFGMILTEKEKGAIQKDSKIANLDFVTYPETSLLSPGSTPEGQIGERKDNDVVFGKDAKPWVPKKPPTFGQVGARLGLGMYRGNMELQSGSLNSKNSNYPLVYLEGEVWITPEYSIHADIKQAVIAISNPRSGSSPTELNQSLSAYSLLFGYNWRLGPNIWGPKVEALFGYSTYRLFVDNSNPRGLTTLEYGGFKLGVDGSFPVSSDGLWSVGARVFLFIKSSLNESPNASGGNPKNSINQFQIYGFYKFRENMKLISSLDVEMYSTSYSGAGDSADVASSVSQKHTTLSGGIQYMF